MADRLLPGERQTSSEQLGRALLDVLTTDDRFQQLRLYGLTALFEAGVPLNEEDRQLFGVAVEVAAQRAAVLVMWNRL